MSNEMSIEVLMEKADKQWAEIRRTYSASKKLLIQSEEKLKTLRLYPAPLLEHRDALDHIMNYSRIISECGLCEAAVNELSSAKQHEVRAFYDVADYICISIRKEISDTLDTLSNKQIEKVWKEYRSVKSRVIDISDTIADIRNGTRENVESISRYENVIDEMFNIYSAFQTDIQPKIAYGWLYQLRKLLRG